MLHCPSLCCGPYVSPTLVSRHAARPCCRRVTVIAYRVPTPPPDTTPTSTHLPLPPPTLLFFSARGFITHQSPPMASSSPAPSSSAFRARSSPSPPPPRPLVHASDQSTAALARISIEALPPPPPLRFGLEHHRRYPLQ
jgi:hypothetical protein